MYIILDGRVDFHFDFMKSNIGQKEMDDVCYDLSLKKKDLLKQVMEFKNQTGLDKHYGLTTDDVESHIGLKLLKMMCSGHHNERFSMCMAQARPKRSTYGPALSALGNLINLIGKKNAGLLNFQKALNL